MAFFHKKDRNNAWAVADFEREREHLTNFVKTKIVPLIDDNECRIILIRAPVKSGKREIVEYISQRDAVHSGPHHRVHAFVSAWHRTADDVQRGELEIHNMKVFSITTLAKSAACVEWIRERIVEGKRVVIHLDECDYGAGDRQILGNIYKSVRTVEGVTVLLYSATPQEVIFSGEVYPDEDEFQNMVDDIHCAGEKIEYAPPPGYCGPARFLDEGLVFDAMPFFTTSNDKMELTHHGATIMRDLRNNIGVHPQRNVLVLRLSYSNIGGKRGARKDSKAIYQFLQHAGGCAELGDALIIVDKSENTLHYDGVLIGSIQWSSNIYWDSIIAGRPIILVIDQTASRSTEFACHNRIFAYHDFRNTVVFTTISQAQERINHYDVRYGGLQPIRIYCHRKTMELSAGRINYSTYMSNEWKKQKIHSRTQKMLKLEGDRYLIKKTTDGKIHPDYNEPLSWEDADRALQGLGCHTDAKVSARVKGTYRAVKCYAAEFIPCDGTAAGWEHARQQLNIRFPDHLFQNPFFKSRAKGLAKDGRYMGCLREWRVFDFAKDIVPQSGWGVTGPRLTICYKAAVLGLALRYDTGQKDSDNTLATFKSMYCPRY